MWFSLASTVLVVGLVATGASPSFDPHLVELQQHYEHLSYIASFPCRVPQPRTIPVHKLFSQEELHGKAYFPDVTVLHRCDDATGCCTSGHRCDPVHTDSVRLPFKITFLEDVEQHDKGSWLIEYHFFENHTECACNSGFNPRR